jgi:hypothetical protein
MHRWRRRSKDHGIVDCIVLGMERHGVMPKRERTNNTPHSLLSTATPIMHVMSSKYVDGWRKAKTLSYSQSPTA